MPDTSQHTQPNAAIPTLMLKHHVLLRFACALLGILFFATGPLWFGGSNFPTVPLLDGLWVAPIVQRCVIIGVIACLVAQVLFAQREHLRIALTVISVGLIIGLVVLNQHRLQPWLLHTTLLIVILSFGQSRATHTTIRWITIGIYFHSAISKLDYEFLTGGGFYLVRALGTAFHLTPDTWPKWLQFTSVAALPAFELLVAILLASRMQRRGWMLAIAMHAGLLVALFKLNHKPAVLIWNVGFILQAIYFLSTHVANKAFQSDSYRKLGRALNGLAVATVCALPFLNYEPIHIWDNWSSWALYSTRSERIGIFIVDEAKSRLPLSIQQFVGSPSPILCRVKVDRWSLQETGAPVYPEDRFWVAVALRLSADVPRDGNLSADPIHVQIESPANRLSGKRTTVRLAGQQLLDHASQFWLNALPFRSDSHGSQPRR